MRAEVFIAEPGGRTVVVELIFILALSFEYMLRAYQSPSSGTHCGLQ